MQDKVLEILFKAPAWMTADDVATKGKFRSVANVGLCLKNLGDRVASRKSPTRKNQSTGQPLVEWKHADKVFDGDEAAKSATCTKSQTEPVVKHQAPGLDIDVPVVRKNRTTEVFTQPAHDNELADLRAKLKLAEQQRDSHFAETELAQKKIADLEDDVRRHSNGLQEVSSAVIRFLITAQQLTGSEHKPANLQEAEQQIAATIRLMQGRVEELEGTIHQMELEAHQPAAVVTEHTGPFVVRTPSKPPRFTSKHKNAQAVALSAARRHGFAEVFAMVPVGKAVRGAEWKEVA